MDSFLKTENGFQTTLKLIETINRSTDDFLFIWNIPEDKRWFFGDIDKNYDIRKDGSQVNSTPELMRIIHPADQSAVLKSLNDIKNGKKGTHDMDYRWINRKGQKVWINCHGNGIKDDNGTPYLLNKSKGYLLFLDIDGLAAINLSHGRAYGDALLKEIAELFENIDNVITAYHVDHNNFALTLNVKEDDAVVCVYKTIKDAMLEKCTFTASAVPIDKTIFYDETQILDSVNMTLKKAKGISHNRIQFFSSEDLNEKISALALLEELKLSVENNFEGFEVHYQPQLKAGTYDIYGVEALLRYNSKSLGRVFPDRFIPILEQSRLIRKVGMWVLKEALTQCKKWRETIPQLKVSVNFSALQFEDNSLAEKVINTIRELDIDSRALTIELTESIELHSSQQLIDTIKTLKALNINFAIDDFGTGYSNLSYLKQLNIDEIKIDRVFVSGVEKDTYNHKLISNVIEFAKSNAIRTCCEGVESTRELVTLELLLPDVIQGYLFDKPNTPEIIERTYINSSSNEFKQRIEFVNKLYEFKEKMGVIHFDSSDILRKNEVGLWKMRINKEENHFELHMDATMEKILTLDMKYTPKECYDYWFSKIHPDYADYVKERIKKMIKSKKAVQAEFPWLHCKLGDVMVRMSGKRVKDSDKMIVLEGYHKIITDLDEA